MFKTIFGELVFRRGETPVRFQMCGFVETKRTNRREENKEKERRLQTKEKLKT